MSFEVFKYFLSNSYQIQLILKVIFNLFCNIDIIFEFEFLALLHTSKKKTENCPAFAGHSKSLRTQLHNLFAHRHNFLFLANQVQRHSAALGVALRVKTDPWSVKAFAEMVSAAISSSTT